MTDANTSSEEPLEKQMPKVGIGQACLVPPPQHPCERAFDLGFASLISRRPSAEHLEALGAARHGEVIRLPVLHRHFLVDADAREVRVEDGGQARVGWAVLVLHYLCAQDVSFDAREVSLGHFSDCRSYLDVFAKRIIGRFLGTVGRDAEQFAQRSEQLGATRLSSSSMCYRFDVLPRVPIVIVRYEGDDELGPGASVTYRADAEHLLPAEDRVVVAELLLDTLAGKSLDEALEVGHERRS